MSANFVHATNSLPAPPKPSDAHPVLCVIGTRPEAVKMAPVVRELTKQGVPHVVVSTGQHRELVHQTLQAFGLAIDIDLDLMTPGQTPTQVASRVLSSLGDLLVEVEPSWMIVQGDTTTVMAAAIAGAYAGVHVAHLEAGLRTGDKSQPFPEELNRIIAGGVADLHLAPTSAAADNLRREAKDEQTIVTTGNTVVDALLWATELVSEQPDSAALASMDPTTTLVLLTAHRRENFGDPIREALGAIAEIARERDDVQFLYPVHPNPMVRDVASEIFEGIDNVTLCDPLDYFELVQVLNRASFVITDSGGIQEESPALSKPVLVLRNVTERPEAVLSGVAKLVGTDATVIRQAVLALLDDPAAYADMARGDSPYGDGGAAKRTVQALLGQQVQEFSTMRSVSSGGTKPST